MEPRCGSASVKREITHNNPVIRGCGQIAYISYVPLAESVRLMNHREERYVQPQNFLVGCRRQHSGVAAPGFSLPARPSATSREAGWRCRPGERS